MKAHTYKGWGILERDDGSCAVFRTQISFPNMTFGTLKDAKVYIDKQERRPPVGEARFGASPPQGIA